MKLHLDLQERGYDILIERGALDRIGEFFDLDRKVLIVTDDGVPSEYAEKVAKNSQHSVTVVLKQGEASKSFENYQLLLRAMLENGFTRWDCAVAVGGGVIGDITGFAAATYMRGIDFYNVPTTVLSMVDSSVGGKTAIDFDGVKNIVGAFHQPKAVLIDPQTLATLPKRHIANGLAEALKMSLTFSAPLFELFETGDIENCIDEIIVRSIELKKAVVEQDEKESGMRKVLNFGHTLGHGIESESAFQELYHGECIALGMIPMCSKEVRERLLPVLKRLNLPTRFDGDIDAAIEIASHDKKRTKDAVSVVFVEKIGTYEIRKVDFSEWKEYIKQAMKELP